MFWAGGEQPGSTTQTHPLTWSGFSSIVACHGGGCARRRCNLTAPMTTMYNTWQRDGYRTNLFVTTPSVPGRVNLIS